MKKSRTTIEISGFKGSYEWGCQTMLENGLRYLETHPDFDWKTLHSFEGVFGMVKSDEPEGQAFLNAILGEVKSEATGAMLHGVCMHLHRIHAHGYDSWLEGGRKAGRPIFEFDGTVTSCGEPPPFAKEAFERGKQFAQKIIQDRQEDRQEDRQD